MSGKRKRLNLKSVIAVVLTVMFVFAAIGVLLSSPLPDEIDKAFSDVFPSDTTNKPESPSSGNDASSDSNTGNMTEETFSLENYAGPLEFNGGITNYESSSDSGILLPII